MIRRLLVPLVLTVSACSGGGPECGNGELDTAEVCDQTELGGLSCTSLGFSGGVLGCRADCGDFDVTACEAPTTCGNGQIDSPEACDGQDLGNQTCESLNAGAGTLTCNANCGTFDLSACGPSADCGNGVIDGSELCDGTELNGANCQSAGFDGGTLGCASNCRGYDTSSCNRACEPQCAGKQCGDDGCGGTCGSCSGGAVCDNGQCNACASTTDLCASGACVLDVAMQSETVSGTIRWNQAGLTPNWNWRLLFVEPGMNPTNSATVHSLFAQSDERGNYAGPMYPGTYDVYFELESVTGRGEGAVDGYEPVAQGVTVAGPTTLNVDLRTQPVNFDVRVNGAPVPEGWNWNLEFSPAGQAASVIDNRHAAFLSRSGKKGGASGAMYEGNYDLYFVLESTSGDPSGAIFGRYLVERGRQINAPTTLNIDLVAHSVSGTIRLGGQALPESWTAGLRFVPQGELPDSAGTLESLYFENGSSYDVLSFPGTYDVYFDLRGVNGDDSGAIFGPVLLQQGLSIQGATTLNIDIPTHSVSGSARINGAALDPSWGWGLRFVRTDNEAIQYQSQDLRGAGPYSLAMVQGTYDVYFGIRRVQSNPDNAVWGDVLVQGNVSISGDIVLDFDIQAPAIMGAVSVDGASVPSDWEWGLQFAGTGQEGAYLLGPRSGSSYRGIMLPGTYDVSFAMQRATTYANVIWGALPVTEAHDASGSSTLNVALQTVALSGSGLWNGAALPRDWDWRLEFEPVVDSRGQRFVAPQAPGGRYSARMVPGVYDVYFRLQSISEDTLGPVWGRRLLQTCVEVR